MFRFIMLLVVASAFLTVACVADAANTESTTNLEPTTVPAAVTLMDCREGVGEEVLSRAERFCITRLASTGTVLVQLDPENEPDAHFLVEEAVKVMVSMKIDFCNGNVGYFVTPNKVNDYQRVRLKPAECPSVFPAGK